MPFHAPLTTPTRRAGCPAPRLLHVTDVLPFTGDRNSPAIKAACERGHIVHRICEDYDRGELLTCEKGFEGYLEAWKAFLAFGDVKIREIEKKIGGEKFGYVGRLDRVIQMDSALYIIDIKSGPSWPTHGPQTAAYAQAYSRDFMDPDSREKLYRACVHLSADGSYKFKVHKSVHDWSTFKAYLRVAYWEIAAGLREPPTERD